MKLYKNKFHIWEFNIWYITTETDANKALSVLKSNTLYGLDLEVAKKPEFKEHPSAGLCPHLSNIRLLQIFDGVKNVYVFDLFYVSLELLADFLIKGRFVSHFAIYEIQSLTYYGLPNLNIGCSMLLSQLVEGAEHSPYEPDEDDDDEDQTGLSRYKRRSHSLDAVVQRLFGVKVDKQEQTSDWSKDPLDTKQIIYAALDSLLCYWAALKLSAKLKEYKMERAYKLLKDMQHVIASIQLSGLSVDWGYHTKMIQSWETHSAAALKRCKPFFGETNMRSGKQMAEWLANYLKDDPLTLSVWPRTKKGSLAFGKTVITAFAHLEPIAALMEYKRWVKLIDTYGQSLIEKKHPVTSRLHTSYTLGETTTGRLSSRNPNVQNFPRDKEFRNMFAAPKDHVLVVSDFSMIEVRLQAEFSKDPVMLKVFKEKGDIYKTMASFLYGIPIEKVDKDQRFVGKTCVLALAYGMGPTKLELYANNAGAKKQRSTFWMRAHKQYHTTFRVYSQWCDKMRNRASKLGYIETFFGKRRRLTEEELYTRAPNTVIQGSASELMMKAMLICQEKIASVGKIVATVHDELIIISPEKEKEKAVNILADSMNSAMKEMFPEAVSYQVAEAAYAQRWGEAKAEL